MSMFTKKNIAFGAAYILGIVFGVFSAKNAKAAYAIHSAEIPDWVDYKFVYITQKELEELSQRDFRMIRTAYLNNVSMNEYAVTVPKDYEFTSIQTKTSEAMKGAIDILEEAEILDEENIEEDGSVEPYRIVPGVFFDENDNYDKVSVSYYEEDDVLADDHNEILDPVEEFVGNMTKYAKTKSPLFIRNENIATDFEVVRVPGSFMKAAYGYVEDEDDEDIRAKFKKMRADDD